MSINKNEITKEMVAKAMQCKNADELIALAKTGGFELTREEAEAGGGFCYTDCRSVCGDYVEFMNG